MTDGTAARGTSDREDDRRCHDAGGGTRICATGSSSATPTSLHVTVNPLASPRRTRAVASLCKHLNDTKTTYPGTNLTLHHNVTPHPNLA